VISLDFKVSVSCSHFTGCLKSVRVEGGVGWVGDECIVYKRNSQCMRGSHLWFSAHFKDSREIVSKVHKKVVAMYITSNCQLAEED